MRKPVTVYLEAGKHLVSATLNNNRLACVVRSRRPNEPVEEHELTDVPLAAASIAKVIAEIKER